MENNFSYREKTDDPKFNSSLDYLQRIGLLFQKAHQFKLLKDFVSLYDILESIQVELAPRMLRRDKNILLDAKKHQKNCTAAFRLLQDDRVSRKMNVVDLRMRFYDWFEFLSVHFHLLGLAMDDKEDTLAVLED